MSIDWDGLSGSLLFPLVAYICAFLPWSALAATDFISSKWVTVRRTRNAGYRNLMFTIFPMFYVFFYGVVQYKEGDYKEMAAAAVATIFALLILVRTIYGLYQLHKFYEWAKDSIEALKAVGIEYSLLRLETMDKKNKEIQQRIKSQQNESVRKNLYYGFYRWLYTWYFRKEYKDLTSDYVADEILVNNMIADNQLRHGDVLCTFSTRGLDLLNDRSTETVNIHTRRWTQTVVGTFSALLQSFEVAFRMTECLLRALVAFVTKRRPLSNMLFPKDPVQLWVQWASTFASQGLQNWMDDFGSPVEAPARFQTKKQALANLDDRRMLFSWELLAAACVQLWPDHGPGNGISPFLWSIWEENSDVSDGRIVKQNLFEHAISKGFVLPYGTPHLSSESQTYDSLLCGQLFSYANYEEAVKAFISNLPVRDSYVHAMPKFNVHMLEWFTVMLHLGHMSRREFENDTAINRNDVENSTGVTGEHKQDVEEVIISQMGLDRHPTGHCQDCCPSCRYPELEDIMCHNTHRKSSCVFLSTPILRNIIAQTSEANRLVSKAGQFVDVWLSLVYGEQISFLAETLNQQWKSTCLGGSDIQPQLREIHKELETRRLERRIASEGGRHYGYLDHSVTFMGYRMESVRTAIGRWVQRNQSRGENYFEQVVLQGKSIPVYLSALLRRALSGSLGLDMLKRRAVQCRLLWELQNELEDLVMCERPETGSCSANALAAIMLILLSFPGLRLIVRHDVLGTSCHDERQSTDFLALPIGRSHNNSTRDHNSTSELQDDHKIEEDGNGCKSSSSSGIVYIEVVCGPQKFKLGLELGKLEENECVLKVENKSPDPFNWKHWRDAFHGRLEGLEGWQKDLRIPTAELEKKCFFATDSLIENSETEKDTTISFWTEWLPFRTEFCRFELESKDFLRETRDVGNVRDVSIPRVRKVLVLYASRNETSNINGDGTRSRIASDETLAEHCRYVKKSLRKMCNERFPFHAEQEADAAGNQMSTRGTAPLSPKGSFSTLSNPLCRDIIDQSIVLKTIRKCTLDLGNIESSNYSISFQDIDRNLVQDILYKCEFMMERVEMGQGYLSFVRLAQFLITCLVEDSGSYRWQALRLIYRVLSLCHEDDRRTERKILKDFGRALHWCHPIADTSRPVFEGDQEELQKSGRILKPRNRFNSLMEFVVHMLCHLLRIRRISQGQEAGDDVLERGSPDEQARDDSESESDYYD